MPFLDAKALDNDPDGMAFLRSVIRPNSAQEEAVSPRNNDLARRFAAARPLPTEPDAPEAQSFSDTPVPVSVG